MNRLTLIIAAVLVIGMTVNVEAQRRQHYGGHKSGAANAWVFGAHWSFVYSNGADFGAIFDPSNYHGHPYPSRFSLEKYISTEGSVEIAATRNKISADKDFNAEQFTEDAALSSIDVTYKYRFVRFFLVPGFDPYVAIGGGVSRALGETGGGLTLGLGFNTWLANGWGLNFQTTPKINFGPNKQHQYLQHSFGIVYRYFVSDIGARRLERNQNILGGKHPYNR